MGIQLLLKRSSITFPGAHPVMPGYQGVFTGEFLLRTLDHTVAEPPKKTLKDDSYLNVITIGESGCAVQICALAKCRVAINRLDQPLSHRFGIQAEEAGELSYTFAVSQTDDDRPSIGWCPHK